MELAKKLQIPSGSTVSVFNAPPGLSLAGIPRASGDEGDVVLVFVRGSAELEKEGEPAIKAARMDRLAWVAYPKAGQLGTDLNRDRLTSKLKAKGIEPVRQVSLDDVWSGLRFRPKRGS